MGMQIELLMMILLLFQGNVSKCQNTYLAEYECSVFNSCQLLGKTFIFSLRTYFLFLFMSAIYDFTILRGVSCLITT